jgi:hypothetical protein
MKRVWSFYSLATGEFVGRRFSGNTDAERDMNTPTGCGAIEGRYSTGSQRVNLQTGAVQDYIPPAPDSDHEWSADARAWVIQPEIAAARTRRASLLHQIETLERQQLRPIRELALNPDNSRAADVLAAIESQIISLRSQL